MILQRLVSATLLFQCQNSFSDKSIIDIQYRSKSFVMQDIRVRFSLLHLSTCELFQYKYFSIDKFKKMTDLFLVLLSNLISLEMQSCSDLYPSMIRLQFLNMTRKHKSLEDILLANFSATHHH